ncbi:hypothetical protein BDZ97DRAFT_1836624 [Flammula alnicola]|nr:hypothetical protein BDZ97DRAFT_1836624 [Flammula alnicola]
MIHGKRFIEDKYARTAWNILIGIQCKECGKSVHQNIRYLQETTDRRPSKRALKTRCQKIWRKACIKTGDIDKKRQKMTLTRSCE